MDKKIIFLDIDGTLMDFQGNIPESTRKALVLAREAGHRLVLCTGRTKSEINSELLAMNFDGIIGAAGAYVECDGQMVYRHVIAAEHLKHMIDYFEENKIVYCLQTGEGIVMSERNRIGFRDNFLGMGLDEETIWKVLSANIIHEEDSRMRTNVEKAAYYGSPIGADRIQNALGSYFKVEGASYGNNTASNGEIICTGETKATGIQRYVDFIGADIADTVGIGDGLNDVDMLGKTAIAVAMGNAKPETKAIADYVTDHVNKDGLWKAFKYLNLI